MIFQGHKVFASKEANSCSASCMQTYLVERKSRILRGGGEMKSFVSFQKPFMGKEKACGHSAIFLVIWSFPYLCLANTKFLWIVWQTPGGWMDLLSGTGVAPLKGMYNDPSPSLRRLNHCGQAGYSKEQRSKRRRHAPNVDKVDHPSYWSIKSFGGRDRDVILQGN